MIEPEQFLKFQIKSALHLDGQYVEGNLLDEVVDAIYAALFNKNTIASIRYILVEIEEQDK